MSWKERFLALHNERLFMTICCHVFYLSLRQKKSSLNKVDPKSPLRPSNLRILWSQMHIKCGIRKNWTDELPPQQHGEKNENG